MQSIKRSLSEILSPENNPKVAKSAKKVISSPVGLGAMASLATVSPIRVQKMDLDSTLTQLKQTFGADLDDKMLKIATYILNLCNEQINGCIQTLETYYECNIKMENKQGDYNSLVKGLSNEVASLKAKIVNQADKIDQQENYSRRNNLLIRGIPETKWQNVDEITRSFLGDFFELSTVQIERVHRLGRYQPYARRPRAIIVRFVHFEDRDYVWRNKRNLAGSGFFLDEDFSQEVLSVRRKLMPVYREARRQNLKCEIVKDTLTLEGKTYSLDELKTLPKEVRDGSRWSKEQVSFFGELCPASNFHAASFNHEGIHFENSEKAIFYKKAMKFDDKEMADRILKETDPRTIKNLSKSIKDVNESEWNECIKDLITPVLFDKFNQNSHLLEWLRSTERRHLVEAAGPHDRVWGNGLKLNFYDLEDLYHWKGVNKQGSMLMKVRRMLCPELYSDEAPALSSSRNDEDGDAELQPSQILSTQPFDVNH